MNRIEKNILIAEFMGYAKLGNGWTTRNRLFMRRLGFHFSWNELMPVVEKIEEDYYFPITGKYAYIGTGEEGNDEPSIHGHSKKSKHEATYSAVVQFIQWHNENKEE